jgi:1,5-anhydro-D-fructose reductase (1,5-anhydro-D-mannitol-forming)
MSGVIRIGIVGCGNIVTGHLHGFRILSESGFDNFRITALCDQNIARAQMYRKRGEGPPQTPPHWIPWDTSPIFVSDIHQDILPDVYADWGEMLRSAQVDAVLIAAPIGLHHQIALHSFRLGKHVLSEKPLAVSVRAGQRMVDEAQRRGLILGVAENVRYGAGARMQKYLLDASALGDIQMCVSAGLGGSLSLGLSPDAVLDGTPWRHRKVLAGGGLALDAGVHTFHSLRYLCGEVREISAMAPCIEGRRVMRDASDQVVESIESEVEDTYFAHLKFENGAVGAIISTRAGHGEPSGLNAIYGTKGCLKGGEAILDGGQRISVQAFFDERAPAELKERWFPCGIRDSRALEQLDFLRAVESGKPMETDGQEGERDLGCAFAVLESSAANRPIEVSDVLSGKVGAYQLEINEHYGL